MPPPSKRREKPCRGCQTLIRNDNTSGYCARCVKSSPEYRAKVAEGAKRRYSDPEQRQRTGQGVRRANQVDPTIRARKSAAMREIAATPEWQERNRASCSERRLWEKGVAARTAASNAKQGRTFSQRHGIRAWCPPEYVEMARDLRRNNVPLDDVKRMVAEQQALDVAKLRRQIADNHAKAENDNALLELRRIAMGLHE